MPEIHDTSAPGGFARRPVPQHLDTDALTAYLDGRMEQEARTVAASHLAGCPDCRRELTELRTTVRLLRSLPQYRPRRSFQLGAAYAKPAHASRLARFLPLLPALRSATAVAALLLAVITAAGVMIDSADAPRTATVPATIEVVPPADARAPTGREPLADDVAVTEGVVADDTAAAAAGETANEAADEVDRDGAEREGAMPAAPASASDQRPSGASTSQEGADAGAVPAESDDRLAGGDAPASAERSTERAAPAVRVRTDERDGLSAWHAAQIGVGIVLAALVVALVALQRIANRARRLDPGF